MLNAKWSLTTGQELLWRNTGSGKFHELDHVGETRDEVDELASLPLFVGVAGWPERHKGPPPGRGVELRLRRKCG